MSCDSLIANVRTLFLVFVCVFSAWASADVADAVRDRDKPALRALLAAGKDVNAAQGDGSTALHWAAHWDDPEIAESLLLKGANVNARDSLGVTPLALACQNGGEVMVSRLLGAGADPNLAEAGGETPLMVAAVSGSAEVTRLLIAHHADVNAKESARGQTVLMRAVAENHPDVVRLLIAAGADAKARSNTGFTAMLFAAQQGSVESTRLLLAAGADVNETAPDGIGGDTNTRLLFKPGTEAAALLVAIDSGHEELALFLIAQGADVKQSGAGRTPVHSAVQRQMPRVVEALLDKGADINARISKPMPLLSRYIGQQAGLDTDVVGATPFWLAAEYSDVPMMRLLAKRGADTRLTTVDGTTPLMAAAGIDFIEGQDRYGRRWFQDSTMPLQLQAIEATKLALELNNEINAVNRNGQTALHGAAYMGCLPLIQILIEKGANPNIQNKLGQTPYYITQGVYQAGAYFIRKDAGELLLRLGADPKIGNDIPHRDMSRQ